MDKTLTKHEIDKKWINEIRALFNQELEKMKQSKTIGRSEEVFAEIHWPDQIWDVESVRELLKCARVRKLTGPRSIVLTKAEDAGWLQCPRCRRYWDALYNESGHGMVCERCDRVMHMLDFDAAIR
jgi:hypothetical protein